MEISTAEAGRAGDVAVESNRGGDGAGAPGAMEGAPDRGWRAWATVAATFSVFMHAVAIHYLFSMFYPEFLGEFQATRSGAAWAGSVRRGSS